MPNLLDNTLFRVVLCVILLAAGGILYVFLSLSIIPAILFIFGIAGFGLQIFDFFRKKPDNGADLADVIQIMQEEQDKLRDDYEAKLKSSQDEVSKTKSEYEARLETSGAEASKAKKETTGTKKILAKINATLEKEHITKAELIEKIGDGQYTIMVQKYYEPDKVVQKKLIEYKFKTFGNGIYILPPVEAKKMRINADFDVEKWLNSELLKGLPVTNKYLINFATLVDIKKMASKRYIVTHGKTYLEVLEPEDLVTPEEIITYLKDKKNISLKDIIQIPNLTFLVEDYMMSSTDYDTLKEKSDEILLKVKKSIKAKQLKTTDLAIVDQVLLSDIIKEYVSKPDEIAKAVISNSMFWNDYLNKSLKV